MKKDRVISLTRYFCLTKLFPQQNKDSLSTWFRVYLLIKCVRISKFKLIASKLFIYESIMKAKHCSLQLKSLIPHSFFMYPLLTEIERNNSGWYFTKLVTVLNINLNTLSTLSGHEHSFLVSQKKIYLLYFWVQTSWKYTDKNIVDVSF